MANEFQDLSTFSLPGEFRGRSAFVVQLWWLVQATLFGCSPQFLYGWRRFLLRLFGASIGKHVLIRPTAKVQFPWKLTIGEWSWIGDDVVLYSLGQITIGSHSVISQRSYICAGSHRYDSKSFDILAKPVTIESEVWIATDCFVAPGVTIGNGAMVGARSTVLTNLPAGTVCFGSPAVAVKPRTVR
jgi:putative colanic acid biosynthesis acetyltransferase WcaF